MVQKISDCPLEDKQLALQRALESRTFRRSEQMRSFLQYICEASFRGDGASINEYLIGTQVLHRPPGYSPAEDSSVRTRAYELRQKLERLYADELPAEEIRISIPKGAYEPEFVHATAWNSKKISSATEAGREFLLTNNAGIEANAHRFEGGIPLASLQQRWQWIVLLALTALTFGLSGYFLAKTPAASVNSKADTIAASAIPVDPLVREVWSSVAKANSQSLLIPAVPLYLVLGPESHHAYGTHTYTPPPEAYALFRQHRPLMSRKRLGMLFTEDALGVGSMDAVVIASNTIHALGGAAQILPERASMMPALHDRNVMLFGAPVDSELISELLEKTPFTVDYDETVKEFVVRDRINGQICAPEMTVDGDFKSVYGLVTVLNTRESEQGRLGTIILSGITSVGTHGAAEYFASPSSLKALLEVMARTGMSRFPPAFQVVVKCKIDKLQLISAEYQTHRVLQAN